MHSPQQTADHTPDRDAALRQRIALLEAQMAQYGGDSEPARRFSYGADGTLRYDSRAPDTRGAEPPSGPGAR